MFVTGTTVSVAGRGVLLVGPSGAGKSDLALRLIDRGALLVGDDACRLLTAAGESGTVWLGSPPRIAGLLEIRGLGLVSLPYRRRVRLALVVQCAVPPERLPEAGAVYEIAEVALPLVVVDPQAPSAALQVEAALMRV